MAPALEKRGAASPHVVVVHNRLDGRTVKLTPVVAAASDASPPTASSAADAAAAAAAATAWTSSSAPALQQQRGQQPSHQRRQRRVYRRSHLEPGASLSLRVERGEIFKRRWILQVSASSLLGGGGGGGGSATAAIPPGGTMGGTSWVASGSAVDVASLATAGAAATHQPLTAAERSTDDGSTLAATAAVPASATVGVGATASEVLTTVQLDLRVRARQRRTDGGAPDLASLRWGTARAKSVAGVWALQSGTVRCKATGQRTTHLMLLPRRDPANFLSTVPPETPISALCLPGTHETLARYGWPISACQSPSSTVTAQLNAGIRFMDLRFNPRGVEGKERLYAAHGVTDQRIEAGDVFKAVYDWLDGPGRTDFVILSIKAEGPVPAGVDGTALFYRLLLDEYVAKAPAGKWWVEDRVPTLGEARGKAVLFARFGNPAGREVGVRPDTWPNSLEGIFDNTLPSTPAAPTPQRIEVQDWYNIGSASQIDRKLDLVRQLLASSGSDPNTLSLNFTSASSFPLALPATVAVGMSAPGCLRIVGMNERLRDLVASSLAKDVQQQQQPQRQQTHPPPPQGAAASAPEAATRSEKSTGATLAADSAAEKAADAQHGDTGTDVPPPTDGATAATAATSPSWAQLLNPANLILAGAPASAPPSPPLPTAAPRTVAGLMCTFAVDFFERPFPELVSLLIEANFSAAAAATAAAAASPQLYQPVA